MRFARSLIYLIFTFQSMAASAAGGDENERLSNIVRKNTTPALTSIHLLGEKELGQSDKNTGKLVLTLLLQNQNIEPILRKKNINLNAPVIIDSCELRVGLQTKEMYDLFCGNSTTPSSFIQLSYTPLQATCLTGDLAAMKILIKAGANIDEPKELSPLAACLATKRPEQAVFLIDQGADVRTKPWPFTLLNLISHEFTDDADQVEAEMLAEKIIAKGADPHFYLPRYGGFSEIAVAAAAGNLAMVKVLVKHGVDFNKKSSEGLTPLALAKEKNRVAVVEFLESIGAQQ